DRKVEARRRLEAGILGAATEDRETDMGVDVDEAGRHDLAAPVDHPRRVGMASGEDLGSADIDDAVAFDIDRSGVMDRPGAVYREHDRILDQQTHVILHPSSHAVYQPGEPSASRRELAGRARAERGLPE